MKETNVYGYVIKVENDLVVAEDQFPVQMKKWNSPNGKITRYYVTRAGKQVGWISEDKKSGQGKTSTEQTYINRYVEALNS